MQVIDIFSLILSFIGLYGIVFALRLLLPWNVVPLVSTSLNETMALLENAEATNIPNVSDYRLELAMYVFVHISQPPTDRLQPSQPILTDAYREPSLSGGFPAGLPSFFVRSDLEAP